MGSNLLVCGFLVLAVAEGLTFDLFLLSFLVGVQIPIGFVEGTSAIFVTSPAASFRLYIIQNFGFYSKRLLMILNFLD